MQDSDQFFANICSKDSRLCSRYEGVITEISGSHYMNVFVVKSYHFSKSYLLNCIVGFTVTDAILDGGQSRQTLQQMYGNLFSFQP